MNSGKKTYLKCASLSLALALSGCGGGGGSSSSITILSTAQIQNVVKSANSADWIMSTVDSIQFTGYTYLNKIATTLSGANTTTADLGTVCSSGSYTATWNVGSATTFTTGDTITLNLTNCVKPDGYTYNGSESYTVTSLSNTGTSSDEVTINSTLDNLTVVTPQTSLSNSTLTNLSFSNSNMTFTRERTWSSSTSTYTYPMTFKSTGGISSTMSTSAGNIASGTYTISNATVTDSFTNSINHTLATSLTSSDGTFNDVVLTNTQAKSIISSATTAYPIYLVTYAGARITATISAFRTTLSGTNSDGSPITNSDIYSAYFY